MNGTKKPDHRDKSRKRIKNKQKKKKGGKSNETRGSSG